MKEVVVKSIKHRPIAICEALIIAGNVKRNEQLFYISTEGA